MFGSQQMSAAEHSQVNKIVPFNPKHVTYEVLGPTGTVGTVNYLDENAQPQRAWFTALPWSYTITTTMPWISRSMRAGVPLWGEPRFRWPVSHCDVIG
jgi:hypothetical protein